MSNLLKILIFFSIASTTLFAKTDGWIEGKISSMSIEEKVGQMLMLSLNGSYLDTKLTHKIDQVFAGSIILFESNIQHEDQVTTFLHNLQIRSLMRSGIPLIVAVDQEGGLVNRIGKVIDPVRSQYSPRTLGRAYILHKTRTQKALRSFYRSLATRMRQWGINMNLAPVLDISHDPSSPLFSRSFSSNPKTVSAMALNMSLAMQSSGIIVTGKHFPNLGSTKIDSHKTLPILRRTLTEMSRHELYPYFRLKNDLDVIMLGHILVPDIDPVLPVSISQKASNYIRKKIGFDGIIMTDDLKMGALSKNFSIDYIIRSILKTDTDIILLASQSELHEKSFKIILESIRSKETPIRRINDSVRRILQLKRRYLFDNPPTNHFNNDYDWIP